MNTLGLRMQLFCAAAGVAVAVFVTAAIGYRTAGGLARQAEHLGTDALPRVKLYLQVARDVETIKAAQRALLAAQLSAAERDRQLGLHAAAVASYTENLTSLAEIANEAADQANLDSVLRALQAWERSNEVVQQLARDVAASEVVDPVQLEAWIEGFRGDHYAAIAKASAQVDSASPYEGGADATACRFGKWLGSYQTKNTAITGVMERAMSPHQQFHASVGRLQQALAKKDATAARKILDQETRPAATLVIGTLTDIEKETAKARALYDQIQTKVLVDGPKLEAAVDAALKKVVAAEIAESSESAEQAVADGRQARTITLSVAVVGALGVLVLGGLFGARIAKKLHAVVDAVGTGAAETASAATQVASASQSLAAGANEQASSLEETSASLIELSATTKRNADNATEVRDAATKARASADASATQMARMNDTMAAIKGASVDITKTLKTIDEIAFQTNILALNAAVEAARAGEAGAGFAVVADEVRALAQRAAAAAKETEERITAAVTRSHEGAELSQQVHDSLKQIQEQIHHLDQLVAEIATASIEQRNGFEQVSAAVAKIDQITQSNASNAEETASTSEELNAQVASLKDQTEILRTIVEGARSRGVSPTACRTEAVVATATKSERTPSAQKQAARPRRSSVPSADAAAQFEHFLSMDDEPGQNGSNGNGNGSGHRR